MKLRLMSYAQEMEDIILWNVLRDIENGRYVDVGANDPWEISVTQLFYDKGWRGVNIEPLSEMYDALVANRPEDVNVKLGAGQRSETKELLLAGACSTCNPDEIKKWGGGELVQIEIKPLREILSENDEEFQFMKIDVEGFEREVLLGNDFDRIRPWIIVMESTYPRTSIPNHDRWEEILFDAEYSFIIQNGINRYYLRNDKLELSSRFLSVEDLEDLYDVFYVRRKNININRAERLGNFILKPIRPVYKLYRRIQYKMKR